MKKRIIIVGDSFSLGVGADFPPFENLNKYAPPIEKAWLDNWYQTTTGHYKDIVIRQSDPKVKENTSVHERTAELSREYQTWTRRVFTTDFYKLWKQDNTGQPTNKDLKPGIQTGRSLAEYSATWSNQLQSMLPDTEVINLSKPGGSMATVVSALTTYINMNATDDRETLVFFQAPDPARRHVITSELNKKLDYEGDIEETGVESDFDTKMYYIQDFNIASIHRLKPDANSSDTYDIKDFNKMYIEKNLYIGEWYQNIYNMQSICKANNFNMAWCTSTIPVGDIIHNDKNEYPNVMDIDIRFDRMPHNIDKQFVSFTFKNEILGIKNAKYHEIMSGCRHYTPKVQQLFAKFMANSLITNEDFWWQK